MERVYCANCRDVIGMYEPIIVVLSDGRMRHGSRLTLGPELDEEGSMVVHAQCDGVEVEPWGGGFAGLVGAPVAVLSPLAL
jgi:hypothetical protein